MIKVKTVMKHMLFITVLCYIGLDMSLGVLGGGLRGVRVETS